MKIIIFIFLFTLFSNHIFAQPYPTISLDSLVSRLKADNPQLKSLEYNIKSFTYKMQQRTAWEAPMLGFALDDAPIKTFPEQKMIRTSLSQLIPFPGKKSLESHSVMFEQNTSQRQTEAVLQDLLEKLYIAYYDLYFREKKLDLIKENQNLIHQLGEVATKQYETGIGKQADILKAQTEYSLLKKEELMLNDEMKSLRSTIGNLIGVSSLPFFKTIEFQRPQITNLTTSELVESAKKNQPLLQMIQSELNMTTTETELAKKERYPDFTLTGSFKQDVKMNENFWMLELGISLPIAPWSDGIVEGKIQENEMKKKQLEYELIMKTNDISNEIESLESSLNSYKNIWGLYLTTIIPQAELTLQSTLSSYKTGKAQFIEVNEAHHLLVDAKVNSLQAENDFLKTYIKLQKTMGTLN